MKPITALIFGILFGFGLAFSGMTNTEKVLGFLDISRNWDISLLLVMVAALSVSIPGYALIFKRAMPLLTKQFSLPTHSKIDKKLLLGSTIFGIGWGMAGWCPGPVIASLHQLSVKPWLFLLAMLIGMYVASKFNKPIIA